MLIVYGIKNCDTIKKACNWLTKNNIAFQFHDFRKDGITQSKIKFWVKSVDWELLLNRRGTTWRKIPEQEKSNITKSNAIKLMTAQPTLIKRPVIEHGEHITVGFSENSYTKLFKRRG